jgi:hypothetical protein
MKKRRSDVKRRRGASIFRYFGLAPKNGAA